MVPYSLVLPFVLVLYRFAVRLGAPPEAEEMRARLVQLAEGLRRMDETVEGRVSRALAQLANARDDLRSELAGARRTAERLALDSEDDPAVASRPDARFDPSPGRG